MEGMKHVRVFPCVGDSGTSTRYKVQGYIGHEHHIPTCLGFFPLLVLILCPCERASWSVGSIPSTHPEPHFPGQLHLVAVPRMATVPGCSEPPTVTAYPWDQSLKSHQGCSGRR